MPALGCLAILSTIAGCHHKIVSHGAIDRDAVVHTGERVCAIRELPFLQPVAMRMAPMRTLKQLAAAQAGRDRASGRAGREGKLLALLGLIPWGADPARAAEAVIASQPAGYYVPSADRLEIVARDYVRSEVFEIIGLVAGRDLTYGEILAHELTHALQDQHFGLEPPAGADTNSDAAIAHAALVEGDATLVGFELGVGGLFSDAKSYLGFARRMVPDMGAEVPSYYQERFKFPYLDGGAFVLALREQGGLAAVDRTHRAPPRSTEEVLHPEKYLRGDDPPRIPDLASVAEAADGYTPVHEDTLGELGIRTLMLHGERGAASRRSDGWGGDRAMVLERQHAPGLLLVWVVSWDTPADAAGFVTGLEAVLEARLGAPDSASLHEARWESTERVRYLEIWHNRVVFVDAPTDASLWPIVQAAFRAEARPLQPRKRPKPVTARPMEPDASFEVDERPLPRRRDASTPMTLRIGSSDASLALGSMLQIAAEGSEGLNVQRLRARAEGVVTPMLDLRLAAEFELGTDDPGLLDAVLSFSPVSPNVFYLGHLRIGRFRVPFSRMVLIDPEVLDLNERPLAAVALAPARRTGFAYDLDLGRHGLPVRIRAGTYDGFPEGEGFGPLYVARLDVRPSDFFGSRLLLELGSAYLFDDRHQDAATGLVRDRHGVSVDGRVGYAGYHLEAELLLLDRTPDSGLESLGWSLTAGAYLLPDFLELVLRYEELDGPDLAKVQQVSGGVNLFYLAERFRMAYNFVWRKEENLPDRERHVLVFQLVL